MTRKRRSPLESYKADLSSLKNYRIPEWYKDAKLGIFIHWGPYCVPEYGSEWYPRLMYMDDGTIYPDGSYKSKEPSEIYKHHIKYWGSLRKFGYKDFIPMFEGESFNPVEWMNLFRNAGARYVVSVAEHHDGFAMYKSSQTRWNAVDMGPKRDILKELEIAAHAQGLKFGASSHYAFNWNYYVHKEGHDTMDPAYYDLYGQPHQETVQPDQQFINHWWRRTKDIVDNYDLDILWFDFYWNNTAFTDQRLKTVAYFYNSGIKRNKKCGFKYQGTMFFT